MNNSPFKENCLDGRVCLITGGGSGIGFGIASTLGQHGAKVVIMGRREQFLDDAVAKLEANGVVRAARFCGDVRSEADANAAVAFTISTFGKMDTLVNCAAGNFLSLAEDISVNGFRTVLEIDTMGVFIMSKAAFDPLRASSNGVILNISTTFHYGATWYQTHACAAKAAIDSLTRQFGLEWGAHGIRVNGIAPGPIEDTPGFMKLNGTTQPVPLGRTGTTQDIGMTALFLCTNAASFITGETIVVDGATWLWHPPPVARDKVKQMAKEVEKSSRRLPAKM